MHNLPLEGMSREVGRRIGASVGDVVQIDVNSSGKGWEKSLRVKIMINLTHPLARGRVLNVQTKKLWISF